MTDEERKVLYLFEYLYNEEVNYKYKLEQAIYTICIKKKWNADNFNAVIQAFYSYKTFQKLNSDISAILTNLKR